MSGGYDVNVRLRWPPTALRVLGRVLGASDGRWQSQQRERGLDEADAAYAGFLVAAREFAAEIETWNSPRRSPSGQRPCRPPSSRSSPSTCGARTLSRSSGRPATTMTTVGCEPGVGCPGPAAPAAWGQPVAGALLPWPALDAYVQVGSILRRRERRRVPRRTHVSRDWALTMRTGRLATPIRPRGWFPIRVRRPAPILIVLILACLFKRAGVERGHVIKLIGVTANVPLRAAWIQRRRASRLGRHGIRGNVAAPRAVRARGRDSGKT